MATPSGLEDVSINDNLSTNDKFAPFAEALQTADNNARLEVQRRQRMQERLAHKEKDVRKEKQARIVRLVIWCCCCSFSTIRP
jgi:hypothetical protein